MAYILAVFLLLFVQVFSSNAVCDPQVRISESSISRKIIQPSITALFKDQSGFFWIGTQHALYRFDGVDIIEFSSNQKGSQWIPVSDIKAITEDFNGQIIVATYGAGLLSWDSLTKSFHQTRDPPSRKHLYVKHLSNTPNGQMWVGTEAGLYSFNHRDLLEADSLTEHGLVGEAKEVSAIASDTKGNTYFAFGKGLYKMSSSSESITKVVIGGENAEIEGQITALSSDGFEQIYIGTEAGELLSIDTKNDTVRARIKLGLDSEISVLTLLFHDGILWIGTNSGLSYSDSALSFLEKYSQSNSGLSNDHVLTLLADGDLIWIGTYRGLNVLSYVPFDIFNSQNSNIFDDVLAFEEDEQKRLWVGTFNGLFLLDEKARIHKNHKDITTPHHILDQRIMTLSSKSDELWVGLQQTGVQIVNTSSFEVKTLQLSAPEPLEVTKILHTDEGHTWIGTYNQGLYKVTHGKTISFLASRLLREKSIIILYELQNGRLLASSENQIYIHDKNSENFSPLDFVFPGAAPFPLILSISQSQTGDIWIGTKDQGLFIWPKSHQLLGSMSLDQVDSGLHASLSTVYGIQFDDDRNAWCSTQNGIVKLSSNGQIIASFNSSDGTQGRDFNFGASFKDSAGRIYFGGSNGYNRFYPESVYSSAQLPRLSMTKIGISRNSRIEFFDSTKLENIQLTHNDYFIQFNFSVLDFLDPEKNQYRYMLEGFDPDWIDNGTRNSATYTSLPPGDYTLRVQGANSAGIWNRDGLSMEIEVLPPPWRTWWAYTGYTLLAMIVLWIFKRAYDSSSIERRALKMAAIMVETEERADDEMQEQLEIHDDLVKSVYHHSVSTLTLVSEFIAIKGNFLADSDARVSTEGNIRRVAALALLEDCVYYQNEILLADLNKYTDIITSRLLVASPVDEEYITTINEVSSQPFPIEQASALAIALYELLENALQHAFEDTSDAKYLHIVLNADDSESAGLSYRLTVRDNGMGIPSNIDPLAALTPGLAIVAAMAERLQGELVYTVEKGTTVTISFPAMEHA